MVRSKTRIWIFLVTAVVFAATSGAALSYDDSGRYENHGVATTAINAAPQYQSIQSERVQFTSGNDRPDGEKGRDNLIGFLHPALGDAGSGNLLRLYEYYDGIVPVSTVFMNGSDDDGLNWSECCWYDLYGSMYPSIDYWGSGTQFYGTFVPPTDFLGGGAVFLLDFPDQMDPYTWDVVWAPYVSLGWFGMTMNELAADNGKETWNWGFQSAIMSRVYPETDTLRDVAHVFYQVNSTGTTSGSWYTEMDSCKTTSADIDHVTSLTYAVYDRFNYLRDQYELFVRQDTFGVWTAGTEAVVKNFTDSNEHIIYPVVAAYDDNVVIVAATYHDDTSDDKDIVCWYTHDGDIDSLNDISVIAGSSEPENYPEVSHVENESFVCTYVSNGDLYACRTDDAGETWSTPEIVNEADELVIEEYRTADIGDGGDKVMYEYTLTREGEVFAGLQDLDEVDTDGDGVFFYDDNCPLAFNPTQTDTDTDGIGDMCDNCPEVANPMQVDSDFDGIGDACDVCPNDPLNDDDEDGVCGGIDNCIDTYNPMQLDEDGDGVGDLCDNCQSDENPDQADADTDGIGDVCDLCTDTDGDGFGNPGYPANTCDDDNCQWVYNSDQADSNSDGVGDACDFDCGDVDGSGGVDIDDVVYLIQYIFAGGPTPDPITTGDVNMSGGVDIDDIVYLVNYIFAGGPEPCAWESPSGEIIGSSDCIFPPMKVKETVPPEEDCLDWEYDGQGTLTLQHVHGGFNCCPIIGADISIVGNTITTTESETYEYGEGCSCLCVFNVDYEITNLAPGEYEFLVVGMYLYTGEPYLQFTADLAAEPTGSFCLTRDHYPWTEM